MTLKAKGLSSPSRRREALLNEGPVRKAGLGGPAALPPVTAGSAGRAMGEGRGFVRFERNVCGRRSRVEHSPIGGEAPTCMGCRSAVRLRSVVHPPSTELFGESLGLRDFPESKDVSGVGLSDWRGCARRLNSGHAFAHPNCDCAKPTIFLHWQLPPLVCACAFLLRKAA